MDNKAPNIGQSKSMFRLLLSYIIPGVAGLLFNSLYIVVDGLLWQGCLAESPCLVTWCPRRTVLLPKHAYVSRGRVMISNKSGRD